MTHRFCPWATTVELHEHFSRHAKSLTGCWKKTFLSKPTSLCHLQVKGTSIGWSLGYMLSSSNMIPSEMKTVLPLTDPLFAGLVFLFSALAIVLTVVVFVVIIRACYWRGVGVAMVTEHTEPAGTFGWTGPGRPPQHSSSAAVWLSAEYEYMDPDYLFVEQFFIVYPLCFFSLLVLVPWDSSVFYECNLFLLCLQTITDRNLLGSTEALGLVGLLEGIWRSWVGGQSSDANDWTQQVPVTWITDTLINNQ